MKRKAVLKNLAGNLHKRYKKCFHKTGFLLPKRDKSVEIYREKSKAEDIDIVIFKLEFDEMRREMFSGMEVGEYDQEVLYKAVRQEYLDAPIWCRARNASNFLIEYMMIKESHSDNFVQVEIRNFDLGVYKK